MSSSYLEGELGDLLITQIEQVKDFKSKIALENIVIKMMPLIKKYARKLFFMDKEDAIQELSLALIEAVNHIEVYKNEAMCLAYLQKTIINNYNHLCKNYIKEDQYIDTYKEVSEDVAIDEDINKIELYIFLNEITIDFNEKQKNCKIFHYRFKRYGYIFNN